MGLLNWLGRVTGQGEYRSWQVISGTKVPHWVRKRTRGMNFHKMADEGYYHVLEGRHFQYRVSASGHHGQEVFIERRLK